MSNKYKPYNNQCDNCNREITCLNAPTDNCADYDNDMIHLLNSVRTVLNALEREVRKGNQRDKEIIAKAKIEGAREFAETLKSVHVMNFCNITPKHCNVHQDEYCKFIDEKLAKWNKESSYES